MKAEGVNPSAFFYVGVLLGNVIPQQSFPRSSGHLQQKIQRAPREYRPTDPPPVQPDPGIGVNDLRADVRSGR